jgi:hypothetical protein
MNRSSASLEEVALAEEEARHAAAQAAIRARSADILQLQKLVTQLQARGFHAAAIVSTSMIAANCACNLTLMLSATRDELRDVFEWFSADGIDCSRLFELDVGNSVSYSLKLSRQNLRLQVFLHSATPRQSKLGMAS